MRVLILGSAGFLGKRLANALLQKGDLNLSNGSKAIEELILFDNQITTGIEDQRLTIYHGDICDTELIKGLFDKKIDVIFHLAAIVSGEAEKNFDLGMNVNLRATLNLLEIIRGLDYCPRFVFASSCGVYGGELSDVISDQTAATPQSSYGTQKAMADLLVNDYSRRGWIDGRALRLPTIVVRPGKPNAATSSFASSIIREPLEGRRTECPVSTETKIWILSPRRVTDCFIHASEISGDLLGRNRIIVLPGLTTTVKEILAYLQEIGGEELSGRVVMKPDAFIQSIVLTWPPNFKPVRALELGFKADNSIDEVIDAFIEEDMVKI